MKNRIMIDLETLGTAPQSVITSVGAVRFSHEGISDTFYNRVDWQSSVDAGMKMDVSTVKWWLKQSDTAREEIVKDGQPLIDVLFGFSCWVLKRDKFASAPCLVDEMWGNGATFDNVLLSEAYRLFNKPRPWGYSADRCYRTMKNVFTQIPFQGVKGVAHNALDDARAQAWHLIEIEKFIGDVKT